MVSNHVCRFNVDKNQFEKIRQEAKEKGYLRLAPYFRDLIINRNEFIEFKIIETNQLVKKILERLG